MRESLSEFELSEYDKGFDAGHSLVTEAMNSIRKQVEFDTEKLTDKHLDKSLCYRIGFIDAIKTAHDAVIFVKNLNSTISENKANEI